jgi:hypothetical protein
VSYSTIQSSGTAQAGPSAQKVLNKAMCNLLFFILKQKSCKKNENKEKGDDGERGNKFLDIIARLPYTLAA